MPRTIYLDYNATHPILAEIHHQLLPILAEIQGNPSSIHALGRKSKVALEDAREQVAALLGREARALHFCSGATEANQSLLRGMREIYPEGGHIISSQFEHPSIEMGLQFLENHHWQVTRIGLNEAGDFDLALLLNSIQEDTKLITVMWANNETGQIFPIPEMVQQVKRLYPHIWFHSDTVQALGKSNIPPELELDFLSFSGHKIGALKGIGALWKNPNIPFPSLIEGGPQEREFRGGTENLWGAISFGLAAQYYYLHQSEITEKCLVLKSLFEEGLKQSGVNYTIHAETQERLCNTISVRFPGCRSDLLLMGLDLKGIATSSGSACSSGSSKPSRILLNMGLSEAEARSTLRISFGPENTHDDVHTTLQTLTPLVQIQQKKS